jgi:hypothetical protein
LTITREQARQIAVEYLASNYPDCALFEGETEKAYGWIFGWNSRKYVESRRSQDFYYGNGPLLVDREDGRIVEFGSGDFEECLTEYERARAR